MYNINPVCPHCGQAKLQTEDVIDTYTDLQEGVYVEFTIASCPKCSHTFQFNNVFNLRPAEHTDITDITEEEEDAECG